MNSLGLFALLAQNEATLTVPPAAETPVSQALGAANLAMMLAVIVLPFVLGHYISRWLKMKEKSTAIGAVLFATVLCAMPFATRLIDGQPVLGAIDLGIDLAGGTNMVFQVDRDKYTDDLTDELMNKMVEAIGRRVNPTGTEEVTVRRVGIDRIEVIVPGADKEKKEQVKRRIVDLGLLEFAVLANEIEHSAIIAQADALGENNQTVKQADGAIIAKWRPAAVDKDGTPKFSSGDLVHSRTRMVDNKSVREFLVVLDPNPEKHLTGKYLRHVQEQFSDRGMVVGFTFNPDGGQLMTELTTRYQQRPGNEWKFHLAILLNEQIQSAPTINGVIGSSGQIEGRFSQEEIDSLISVLNAGALQVPLYKQPVSEFTVSPLLGEQVMQQGLWAMGLSLIAVFLVTLMYYLKAGFIADVCLVFNIIMVMGVMSLIDATFTLPGLAGLVLSIAMAVDANVLIFERMREEQAKGSSLRMSIKNGFEKAFSTIFDSNFTTLITAVVLYYIGTDQVKGFAVTLFIGVVISMFTAVYIGRLIFDIAEHRRWLTDLKMMSLIKAQNFDFLGMTKACLTGSAVIIGLGLAALAMRGNDNFDIDFRGGSMVTFKFVGEAPPTDAVENALKTQFKDNIAVERLNIEDEVDKGAASQTLFRMRTIESVAQEVSRKVKEAFADTPYKLIQQHANFSDPVALPPAAPNAIVKDVFAGGNSVEVNLEEAMLPQSLADEAVLALSNMKVPQAKELVQGLAVGTDEAQATKIQLKVAPSVSAEQVKEMNAAIKAKLESEPHFEEVNTFDSAVANQTKLAAVSAMLLSLICISAYLWVRFQQLSFGVAACVALVHDVLITLGFVAFGAYLSGTPIGSIFMLEDFKINLTLVAAFLTIIGYSLNDTIVVFDRIREVRGRNPLLTEQMVNKSLNETLSRTLLTSGTTLIVTVILYFLGGPGIHGFCYCLFLGIVIGTYSSIFIASPALVWLVRRELKRTPVISP